MKTPIHNKKELATKSFVRRCRKASQLFGFRTRTSLLFLLLDVAILFVLSIMMLLYNIPGVQSLRTGPLQRHTLIRNIRKFYPNWHPSGVLDIGANKGMYSSVVRELYPASMTKIIMIEASSMHNTTLHNFVQKDNYQSEYYITVLSSSDDQIVNFYDSRIGNTGNSMFQEQTKHFINIKPLKKSTKTVDSIIS